MNKETTGRLKTVSKILQDIIPVTVAFLTVILLSRLCEWGILYFLHGPEVMSYSYLGISLIYDLQITLIAAVPLGLIYRGTKIQFPRQCNLLMAILITVLALANGALISYFGATLTPLGPEFWIYSVKEMTDTVLAADRFNYWDLILWTLTTVVLFGIARKIMMISVPAWQGRNMLSGLFLISVLIFGIPYWPAAGQHNRSDYSVLEVINKGLVLHPSDK